ncbi:MAG: zf-HC2 domain-containing protein [Anaerolineae bacterium]|jgi:hypothetical protein
MNCETACHLIDDYVEGGLSQYDARRLEGHLRRCLDCAQELRRRPYFEHTLRNALAASVQHRSLSPNVTVRIISEAQGSLRRGIWANRIFRSLRAVAAASAVSLVLIGLFFVLSGRPVPEKLQPIILAPMRQFVLFRQQPLAAFESRPALPEHQVPDPPDENRPALYLTSQDIRLEPWKIHPGESFTLTLFLRSDLPQPLKNARFDLVVSGPTGYYRFEMTVQGPLPAQGVSIVQVTPERLAASSRKKYLMSPEEIFYAPGVYTLRVLLFSPVFPSRQ